MSKYTTQLRWIIEQELADQNKEVTYMNWPFAYGRLGIASSGNVMGLPGYPVSREERRISINNRLIQHYWLKEIGTETIGQFGWRLNEALNLIMPYYNELYDSVVISASKLIGSDYVDTIKVLEGVKGTSKATGSSQVNSTSGDMFTGRSLDTPQAQIQNLDDGWLTRAEKTESEGSGHSDTSSSSVADSTSDRNRIDERTGRRYDPSMYKQLLTIGQELLNIDRMIVQDDEINSCFMLIW